MISSRGSLFQAGLPRIPAGFTISPGYLPSPGRSFAVPERVDGIHVGCPPGRVYPGDDADRDADSHGGQGQYMILSGWKK